VALLMDATLPSTGSGLALWLLESGCRWLSRWHRVPSSFDVAVSAALVLEEPTAEGALEGQFVAVDLLMALQVAEAAEGLVAELAGIGQARASFLLPRAHAQIAAAIPQHLRWRCHVFAGGRGRHPGEPRVIVAICNAKHRQN
uniref:Uncharacterized protein n=1 Tax=Astyanax mexicanus TaxID=7994 RepID=A0A8B9KBJ7_ASTMX